MFLPTLPADCQRILHVLLRAPQRAYHIAQRAYQRSASATSLTAAFCGYTFGWCALYTEHVAEAQEPLQAAQTLFEQHGEQLTALACRRALLVAAWKQSAGAQLQAQWEALCIELAAHSADQLLAQTQTDRLGHLNALGRSQDVLKLAPSLAAQLHALGLTFDLGRLWRMSAFALINSAQFAQAKQQLDQARELFAELRYPLELGRCYIDSGYLLQRQDQFSAAQDCFEQAHVIFARAGLPYLDAMAQYNIGISAGRMGQAAQAMHLMLAARKTFFELERMLMVSKCDNDLGVIAHMAGLYELAAAAYRRSQLIAEQLDNQHTATQMQMNQGLTMSHQRPQLALRLLQQADEAAALLNDPLLCGQIQLNLAGVWRTLGQPAEAHTALQQAQHWFTSINHQVNLGKVWVEASQLAFDAADFSRAAELLQRAAAVLHERPDFRWRILHGLGRCAAHAGQRAVALDHYLEALQLVHNLRQSFASEHASSSVFRAAQALFDDALVLAVEIATPATVLAIIEQQRALMLSRQIHDQRLIPAELHASLQRQKQRLLRAIEQPQTPAKQLDLLMQQYLELWFQAQHTQPRPPMITPELDLVALRANLSAAYPAGWTVLIYAEYAEQLALITLTAASVELEQRPLDPRLRRLIDRCCAPEERNNTFGLALQRVSARPWADLSDLAQQLIPAAVQANLHPDQHLLIVACQALHTLTWPTLRLDSHWLCERAIVQQIPSLTLWQQLQQQPSKGHDGLIIGCEHFHGRALDLPGAKAEVALVERLLPAPAEVLFGAQADPQALLQRARAGDLARFRWLHIASHAQIHPVSGLVARILLHDGDLLYTDLVDLGLGGATVVLSTCYGASGEALPGDEVLSLQRALLIGGARTVIANLWPSNDQRGLALIERLYVHLAQPDSDAASALALAQRDLIASAEHAAPLIWGGFQLLGA